MLQLTGVSFAQLHAELDKVPFGYHIPGANRFQDWRSWEAVFDRKHCLASIMLQQQFPDSMCASLGLCMRTPNPRHCVAHAALSPPPPQR